MGRREAVVGAGVGEGSMGPLNHRIVRIQENQSSEQMRRILRIKENQSSEQMRTRNLQVLLEIIGLRKLA